MEKKVLFQLCSADFETAMPATSTQKESHPTHNEICFAHLCLSVWACVRSHSCMEDQHNCDVFIRKRCGVNASTMQIWGGGILYLSFTIIRRYNGVKLVLCIESVPEEQLKASGWSRWQQSSPGWRCCFVGKPCRDEEEHVEIHSARSCNSHQSNPGGDDTNHQAPVFNISSPLDFFSFVLFLNVQTFPMNAFLSLLNPFSWLLNFLHCGCPLHLFT